MRNYGRTEKESDDTSMKLLWAIRYHADGWAIRRTWNEFYMMDEVVDIPPIKNGA